MQEKLYPGSYIHVLLTVLYYLVLLLFIIIFNLININIIFIYYIKTNIKLFIL